VTEVINSNPDPIADVLEEALNELKERDSWSQLAPIHVTEHARQQLNHEIKDRRPADGIIVREFERESEEDKKNVKNVFTALWRMERAQSPYLKSKVATRFWTHLLERAGKPEEPNKIRRLWKKTRERK
jgi:hypothetical protein